MKRFLDFKEFITPSLITILYYIGAVLIVLFLLGGVIASARYTGFGFSQLLTIVLGIPLSLLLWRVYCELMILLFKIHDRLVSIDDKSK